MIQYDFYKNLTKVFNNGQSRSVVISGNVYDLFFEGNKYVPLTDFLVTKGTVNSTDNARGIAVVLYEVNRPIKIVSPQFEEAIISCWNSYKGITEPNSKDDLRNLLKQTQENPTLAIEVLRQLSLCSRESKNKKWDLLIVIEGADMLLPIGEYSRLSFADRRRVSIFHDWFSDPGFMSGHDSVVMISESRSQIHDLVGKLPQIIEVSIPVPNEQIRHHFISNHFATKRIVENLKTFPNIKAVADFVSKPTAALSLLAIQQILLDGELSIDTINNKVADFIVSQLGEDTIEFKRPTHTFDDVLGFRLIKAFLVDKIIPIIKSGDPKTAIAGAAIAGPIGGGKTFIMEALASILGMAVIVLKNLRSQWYGQTDVILERLKRILEALDKVVIFVDEADTQFGGVGAETHDTERRLTGKIQAMMSDPKLKGRVAWLLMTARIHLLSPDIRRPGRVGDLIIPILDPEGEDREDFIKWVFGEITATETESVESIKKQIDEITAGYSAASFSALRSRIKAEGAKTIAEKIAIANDILQPDIAETRRYQVLQALVNCTRRSLIPSSFLDPKATKPEVDKTRKTWLEEIKVLEAKGVK